MHPIIQKAREIRRRLFNPPNGRISSELEITSERVLRERQAAVWRKEEADRLAATRKEEGDRARSFLHARDTEARLMMSAVADGKLSLLGGRAVPTVAEIVEATCAHYRVRIIDMISARKTLDIARPRQVAMYLAREHTLSSNAQIGRPLGGRDHTTVIHGARRVRHKLAAGNARLAADVAAIKLRLGIIE